MALGYQPRPTYTPSGIDPMLLALMLQQQQKNGNGSVAPGGGLSAMLAGGGAGHLASSAAPQIFSATAPESAADAYVASLGLGGTAPVAAPGPFSFSGIGSAGNALLPAAGLAGAYDLFANKRTGGRGIAQGAASGAAMGSYFGLPGAAIGAGIGAAAGALNRLGDRNRWKTEGNKLKALREKGVNIPDALMGPANLTKGRSKEELVRIENEKLARGQYGNPKFAQSRDIKDLKPEDIWGYSTFFDRYGNDWLGKMSEEERRKIAQKVLDSGALSSKKGTFSVDWNKVDAPTDMNMIPRLPLRN